MKNISRTYRKSIRNLACVALVAGTGASQTLTAQAASTKVYTGPTAQEHWGAIRVRIFVKHRRIINVQYATAPDSARSVQEDNAALPILSKETLRAQSSRIATVSGATGTSQAYLQSLAYALKSAHKSKALAS